MVWRSLITNRPNSKDDSYFVNSEVELTDDIQKECNPDTENKSSENLERLSNVKIEGRSPSSSFNCLIATNSNQIAVNRYDDRFEQLENRISSLEDLINKELARPKTVFENKVMIYMTTIWAGK